MVFMCFIFVSASIDRVYLCCWCLNIKKAPNKSGSRKQKPGTNTKSQPPLAFQISSRPFFSRTRCVPKERDPNQSSRTGSHGAVTGSPEWYEGPWIRYATGTQNTTQLQCDSWHPLSQTKGTTGGREIVGGYIPGSSTSVCLPLGSFWLVFMDEEGRPVATVGRSQGTTRHIATPSPRRAFCAVTLVPFG